jgi:hypothetical protein
MSCTGDPSLTANMTRADGWLLPQSKARR